MKKSTRGSANQNSKNSKNALNVDMRRIRQFPNSYRTKDKADEEWKVLEKAIKEIQMKNNQCLSFEHLYRTAYTMCLNQNGSKLYEGMRRTVEQFMIQDIRPMILSQHENIREHTKLVLTSWEDHRTAYSMIKDIMMYMDRTYCGTNRLDKVETVCKKIFMDQIIEHDQITDRLREHILKKIEKSRRNEDRANSTQMKELTNMMIELDNNKKNFYEKIIEKEFLNETGLFYASEASEKLQNLSCTDYVRLVEKYLDEEKQRTKSYLDPSSIPKVHLQIIDQMVTTHAEKICSLNDSGASVLIDRDQLAELKELHVLLLKSEEKLNSGVEPLLKIFQNKLADEGQKIIADQTDAVKYIEELINLKQRYDRIILEALNKQNFKTQLTTEFEKFMNAEKARTPEYLSAFIDKMLKSKGSKMNTTDSTNDSEFIAPCLSLFQLIHDKDVFHKYYKKHLTNRILNDKISNKDLEEQMIHKLQDECGSLFVKKLSLMFNDRSKWENSYSKYRDLDHSNSEYGDKPNKIDISLKILTQGTWDVPSKKSSNDDGSNMSTQKLKSITCKYLPTEMQLAFEHYKKWWLTDLNSGSKIVTLLPDQGTGDIKYFGPQCEFKPAKTITCNTTRMIIFMLFNKKLVWSLSEMMEALQNEFSERDLKLEIISINGHPKAKMFFVTEGRDSKISIIDGKKVGQIPKEKLYIRLNPKLNLKANRLNLVQQQKVIKNDDPNKSAVKNMMEEDRSHEIEAAIVRIMKTRKSRGHNELITDVTDQVKKRFRPDFNHIKMRIEALIEKDYIKRKAGNNQVYEYVA